VGRYEAALAYHAWWNGYEVVAARSECEARGVMADERTARMLGYDIDSVDGDGWRRLPDDQPILDEDGKPTGENCGEAARTAGKPCHLWSIEP
jgi:hypothetical protein